MTVKEFCRALEENPGVKVRSQEAKQRKECIVCPFRTCVLAFLLGLIGLALPVLPVAIAAIFPTSGTFTGYYHRDTLGVGHFGFFSGRSRTPRAVGQVRRQAHPPGGDQGRAANKPRWG